MLSVCATNDAPMHVLAVVSCFAAIHCQIRQEGKSRCLQGMCPTQSTSNRQCLRSHQPSAFQTTEIGAEIFKHMSMPSIFVGEVVDLADPL